MALLQALDLAFGYDAHTVGQGVNLDLDPGQVLCLLGPNGGGKTTLLKTLVGLKTPLAGHVELNGTRMDRLTPARKARLIGFVPQSAPSAFAFPVKDMVLMGRAARHGLFASPSEADEAIAMAALERTGVAFLADRAFTEISGGERQMALIARALAQEPRILMLDEPTASLDFANQDKVLRILSSLADEGLAVMFSTHHPDQAFSIGSHVAMLRDGRLMACGAVNEVLTAEHLSRLYNQPVMIGEVYGRKVCFTAG